MTEPTGQQALAYKFPRQHYTPKTARHFLATNKYTFVRLDESNPEYWIFWTGERKSAHTHERHLSGGIIVVDKAPAKASKKVGKKKASKKKASKKVGKKKASKKKASKVGSSNLGAGAKRLLSAFTRLEATSGHHNYQTLADLRKESKLAHRFDHALWELRVARLMSLDSADGRHERVTEAVKRGGVRDEGTGQLLVYAALTTEGKAQAHKHGAKKASKKKASKKVAKKKVAKKKVAKKVAKKKVAKKVVKKVAKKKASKKASKRASKRKPTKKATAKGEH